MRCFTPKTPVLAIPLSNVLTCPLQLHCNNIILIIYHMMYDPLTHVVRKHFVRISIIITHQKRNVSLWSFVW